MRYEPGERAVRTSARSHGQGSGAVHGKGTKMPLRGPQLMATEISVLPAPHCQQHTAQHDSAYARPHRYIDGVLLLGID
jgi:hypothetical protein